MPASPITDLSRLCIHTVTTKPWPLATAAQKYAAAGIKGITIWRDSAQAHPDGIKAAGQLCRDEGLEIVSYVRGKRLTIVAITANVTPEDRQACFDAGMDDFVMKPFKISTLKDVILKYARYVQDEAPVS